MAIWNRRQQCIHNFDETLAALDIVLEKIEFTTTESACMQAAKVFQESRESPMFGIITALDGFSVAIEFPKLRDVQDPRKYFNRKGFYSICVQAAVGADYRINYVSAIHAGSTHDSTAYQSTALHKFLEKNESEGGISAWATVAADDAYGNGGRILTPYSGRSLTPAQDAFNYYLSSCRIFVEQVSGVLVSHHHRLLQASQLYSYPSRGANFPRCASG
jgi:DDE superfamily endonuclease